MRFPSGVVDAAASRFGKHPAMPWSTNSMAPAPAEEFVRAEVIRLVAAPEEVTPSGAPGTGADPILPVVAIGEGAARPPERLRADAFQRLDDIQPQPVILRYARVLAGPDPVVDTPSKKFHKVAEDPWRDRCRIPAGDQVDESLRHARPTSGRRVSPRIVM